MNDANLDYDYLKKLRKRILKYGVIRDIFYRLVYPTLRWKPQRISTPAWLDALWDTKRYPIARYKATRTFLMPGARWITPFRKMENAKKYKVLANDDVVARFDLNKKTVDLEVISKQSSCLYTLDPVDWNQVRRRLKEVE